jgi:hypothetical protein
LKVKYKKKFLKKSRFGKKLIGLAKLSYLQDPMSDRNFFLSATLFHSCGFLKSIKEYSYYSWFFSKLSILLEQIRSLSLYFVTFLILCDTVDFFVCFRDRCRGHPEKFRKILRPFEESSGKNYLPQTIEETSGPVNLKTQLNSAKLWLFNNKLWSDGFLTCWINGTIY